MALLVAGIFLLVSCQKDDFTSQKKAQTIQKASNSVGIYHKKGNGTYHLIFVNEKAVEAHLDHGDILLMVPVTSSDIAQNALDLLNNPEKWYFWDDLAETIDPGIGTFVSGPGTPPEGTGSAQISVSGDERYNLANSRFGGTPLADITSFTYITYNPSAGNGGAANRSGFINFNVSFDGTDAFQGRLNFVPKDNGTVLQDAWQEWEVIGDGSTLWRWSGFASFGNQWPDGNTSPLRTWDDLLSSFPDMEMHSLYPFLSVRVGEPYADGYTENIDAFRFGVNGIDQTFDFEE